MNYIGIDLGGTNIKGALVSAEGNILQECSVPTCVDLGPEAVASRIGQVIAQLSDGEAAIGGVGVGCPGTVDDTSGIVRFAANLNFINFDLRSALRAYTALPIHLGNDANAAALGEALFGCGKGAESTIIVTLGTGVGGGVVLGGELYGGARGIAGELGHFTLYQDGAPCPCGKRGCLEHYAATTALVRRAQEATGETQLNGYVIFDRAQRGNEVMLGVLSAWIDDIAAGVTGLVHIFNPEMVLIGGGVSAQEELLMKPLRQRVLSGVMPRFAEGLSVERATLGNDAGMIGAARFFMQHS